MQILNRQKSGHGSGNLDFFPQEADTDYCKWEELGMLETAITKKK